MHEGTVCREILDIAIEAAINNGMCYNNGKRC